MADENTPLDAAKGAADGAKKSALAGLTGMKRVNAGGSTAAPTPKPAEAAADAGEAAAPPPAAKPVAPGAGVKPVAPGAGVKPVAPGAGVKPVAPGAGVKPAAPGAGVKPAAPGAGVKPAAPAAAAAAPAAPAAAKAAPAAAPKKEEPVYAPPGAVNRREFLNYVWAASIALFTAQFGGLTFFFAFPRFRPGQFGGKIAAPVSLIPEVNQPPVANDVGKFWLVNTDAGVNVLYKICTHLGCIYPWSDASGIFACPCHGSQFKLDGTYIAGPAARSLDSFVFEVIDANGAVLATVQDGKPIQLPSGAASILVNTGRVIQGKSNL